MKLRQNSHRTADARRTVAAPRRATAALGTAALALLALAAGEFVVGQTAAGDGHARASPSERISWQGQEWYLHGANVPWYNWGCDFGCGDGGAVDTDADGCSDQHELGLNAAFGGRRDPENFWDFFDTPDGSNARDQIISAPDIARVVDRFGTTGSATSVSDALSPPPATGYHAAFDRRPAPGGDPWDLGPADGAVAAGDIAAMVIQFGHTCSGEPSPLGGGVSDPSVNAELASGFADLEAAGVHVARWWVFPGDPWQITRDGANAPTGINEAVYADFDAALDLAETYDLYLVFTLFSAPSHIPSGWLTDAAQRSQLAGALGELFARYDGHPRVLSWQVFNEPEWDIWNDPNVQEADVQAVVREVADAVHANSGAYVSVGSAMLDGLPMWVGQGLDYYTAHWYDYMAEGNWCARCTDYAEVQSRYGLDAPLVIGEFYAGPDTDALQRFSDFYDKGYAGAWAWSLFPGRTSDGLQIDFTAAQDFAAQHTDIGP